MLKIIKGKLKHISHDWQRYIEGKTLILCTSIGGGWNLCGIEGEESLNGLCEYVWNAEKEEEHEYITLKDMQEDADNGNFSIVLLDSDVEELKEIASQN